MFKWNIKKLDLINKMALLRNGNIPIPVVFLTGEKEKVLYVVNKEKEILNNHFYEFTDITSIKANKVNFILSNNDHLLERNNIHFEEINVNSIVLIDWNKFFKKLELNNISKDMFKDLSSEAKDRLRKNENEIVTKVLYSHYENYDDNEIKDDDIELIYKLLNVQKRSEHINKPKTEPKEKLQIDSNDVTTIHKSKFKGAIKNDTDINSNKTFLEEGVKDTPVGEQTNDSSGMPIPKTKKVEKSNFIIKEYLTNEEEENNKKLLAELKALYKSTINFIDKTCNSQYRIIVNKMKDAADNNIYKQQFTKMYLDISDDTSTDIYAKLYEIDKKTIEFNKNVIHQSKHIGCYNCGTEWEEDITFLTVGQHSVRCPKCYNDFPFDKKEGMI